MIFRRLLEDLDEMSIDNLDDFIAEASKIIQQAEDEGIYNGDSYYQDALMDRDAAIRERESRED